MIADQLAALHKAAMVFPAPWTAESFADILAYPGVILWPYPASSVQKYPGGSARGAEPPSPPATPEAAQDLTGFALGRVVLDEAELLTLAVDPAHRRRGIGHRCLRDFEHMAASNGARSAFLEVAATNTGARALYEQRGWTICGTRPGYYRSRQGRIDAILMQKALNTT